MRAMILQMILQFEAREELRLTALECSRDLVAAWEKKGLYGPIRHDREALA